MPDQARSPRQARVRCRAPIHVEVISGQVIRVTVTGDQPKVSQGQPVRFEELEAIPWANNGRNGVAYRAAAIHPAAQARAA